MTIKMPGAKICGARELINGPVSQPDNRIIPVGKVQIPRGLINRWDGANRFWKYMADPPDAPLGYADGTNASVRCESDQMRIAVWNLVRFLSGDHTTA